LSFLRYPEVLTRSRRLYLKTLTRQTCQRAKRIIAISQSTAQDLVELLGVDGSKIDIAYPGVSPQFSPLPTESVTEFRQKKQLPDHFFLFVGTLEPRKNLPMLLRAYAQLSAAERQATHLILGGGKGWLYAEIFATIERLGLAETVHLPGYIPAEELIYWYNAADALVYPALYEGFGIPVVEALACGKPVLTSNISSLPEAGGAVSVLLPPADEGAWTQALRQTISTNSSNTEINARQAWAQSFTWQKTAQQTLATYRQVLATL
jgi:glycosyltransferase involved in cell wall biosynthesis